MMSIDFILILIGAVFAALATFGVPTGPVNSLAAAVLFFLISLLV